MIGKRAGGSPVFDFCQTELPQKKGGSVKNSAHIGNCGRFQNKICFTIWQTKNL
jgi:hypothetical protein